MSPYGSSSSTVPPIRSGVTRERERYDEEGGRRGREDAVDAKPIALARHRINLVSVCNRARRARVSSRVSHRWSDWKRTHELGGRVKT